MFKASYLNACAGVLTGQTFAKPANFYLGVSTSAINSDGSGMSEPAPASGYVRYLIPNNNSNWNLPVNGVITNINSIQMNTIIADSGTATYWFLSDSLTGDAVIWDAFTSPRPLVTSSNIYIDASELKIGVQNV